MAAIVENIEKPVKIFTKAHKLTKYISLNGNYQDILNTMALLCRYTKVFTTGQVPNIKMLRGGKEAAAVAGLEAVLTGPTIQVNALQDFNHLRDNFFRNASKRYPNMFLDVKTLLDRSCLEAFEIVGEVDVFDCSGTAIGTKSSVPEFIDLWNSQKVPADYAVCGTITPYYFDTYFKIGSKSVLGLSWINPDNSTIAYNAVGIQNHRQRDAFNANRKNIVDEEAGVKPKSLSDFSDKEIL